MQKTVYTTGEAAKICKVSQQTIIRCFDSGQLKGFRVPGSRFRRIPRDQLFLFMRDNGIPTDALESGRRNKFTYKILNTTSWIYSRRQGIILVHHAISMTLPAENVHPLIKTLL